MSAEKKEEKKEAAPAEELTPEQEAAKRKKKLMLFAILGAVVVIAGGAAAFVMTSGGKKKGGETELKAHATEEGHEAGKGEHGKEKAGSHEENKGEHGEEAKGGEHGAEAKGGEHGAEAKGGEHGAEAKGGEHGAEAKGGEHGAEAKGGEGHGGGDAKKGDGKAEEIELDIDFGDTYKLPPFSLNLGNALENRYIRIEIQLEYPRKNKKLEAEIKARQPQLRDAVIGIIQRKTREFLLSPDGKEALRREILKRINQYMSTPITNVYITDFLIE